MTAVFNIAVGFSAGCSSGRNDSAAAQSDGGFRVALLTPGPVSDRSWNGGAYEGLLRIRDSLGARVSHIQTKTPAEFEENLRHYGAAGYSLVIGHGFEFQEAAARVGPEFPRTVYVITGGNTVGANVAALSFSFDEPSYLAGMAAAGASRTGRLACIGGTELPPVKSSFEAFAAGARAVNPGVAVVTSYVGNWDDASAAREQALAQIRRGVDVIFQNADAAGLGVFQAARESKGVRVVGSNADQTHVAPEVALGSVVIDLPRAFLLVAREVKSGTFKPRVVRLDTPLDIVRWVPNPALAHTIAPSVAQRLDSVRAEMIAGRFSAGRAPGSR